MPTDNLMKGARFSILFLTIAASPVCSFLCCCLVPCFREYLNLQMVFVYHFLRIHKLMFSRTFNYAYIHRVDGNHLLALYIFLYAVCLCFFLLSSLSLSFSRISIVFIVFAFFFLLLDAWFPRCKRSVMNSLPVPVRNVKFPPGCLF